VIEAIVAPIAGAALVITVVLTALYRRPRAEPVKVPGQAARSTRA
jgi:hypothetical protein